MSNYEEYYNNFYSELLKFDKIGNTFKKIENFLPPLNANTKILDIGCGYGSVSGELVRRGHDVLGIEINDDAILELNKIGFRTLKHDITSPFVINEKFDVVLILDVLEHIFNPLQLFQNAVSVTKDNGVIIINVPLYFDLIDRLKILFTGSVISMDNLCYGKENYAKFRSYNYDHIRFFRPKDMIEIGNNLNLNLECIEYTQSNYLGKNIFLKIIFKIISNKFTAKIFPNLFAHSMKLRWKK